MNTLEEYSKPYSKAIVRLLKAPVDNKASVWSDILTYQNEIQEYIHVIGLELIIKKEDGFAFVRQLEDEEGNTIGFTARRKIGFETSIVLIALRQTLEEFDNDPTRYLGSDRYLSKDEIREEVELFFPKDRNEVKFFKEIDRYIKQIVELGYLKEIPSRNKESLYQIQRIIKEKVTLDTLREFKLKLEEDVTSQQHDS